MKLLNKSIIYLSVILFFSLGLWAVFFYFNLLSEIKESVDEGLDNYKRQIIYQVEKDSTLVTKNNFDEGFFAIREIPKQQALCITDTYTDTFMWMQDSDDESPEEEPVRMLSSAFEYNNRFYELRIINSMVEEDDLVAELLREALVLYVLLITIIIAINNFVLQRLWKPFYSFLDQLKKYRVGKIFPRVETDTREFSDLQTAVNILLQHNIRVYEQQKEFIGNASHELQTPLAIATNKLELLIEKGNLDSEQAQTIAETMGIIDRLVRLNKSLLLLTKIENKQIFENVEIIWNRVIQQNLHELEDIAAFRNISLSVSENAVLKSSMDNSLANVLVSNLLRNALFHNHAGGLVNVEINENLLRISNTGNESAIHADNLFSRFYKAENSKGTGLGLAIVKAICELYELDIFYRHENNRHIFELRIN